jgi:DNA-binding transcriptional MocR family regulator
MRIPLNWSSTKPIYLQICDHFSQLIQAGTLQAGDRLPSIRALAKALQINKMTVSEAYGVLEAHGFIYARQGAGYFVNKEFPAITKDGTVFSPIQQVIIPKLEQGSFFNLYTAAMQAQRQAGIIDLSCVLPCPEVLEDLQRIVRRMARQITENLFSYDLPQGQPTLRQQIAQLLSYQGLVISPEQIIVTGGAMQGLSLAIRHYVQPGDWVVVESPTFHGALAILNRMGARLIGIPMTAEGMNLKLLEQYLQSHRPKLIYTISTLHCPTGLTTPQSHRQALLALAKQYKCPILEDNAYEGLNFEPVPAPLKSLDQHDLVTYVGTFSKTLMPGLRVGYLVATGQHYQSMLEQKLLCDVHVSTVSQAIISEYLASGYYRRHLDRLRVRNLTGRNVMLQALEQRFPQSAAWTNPKGGMFLWVHLPSSLPVLKICQEALNQGVLVAGGELFFPDRQGYPAMRLTFSHSVAEVDKGISIIANLLHRYSHSD